MADTARDDDRSTGDRSAEQETVDVATTPIAQEAPWLSVIGIGDDGLASVGDHARRLIEGGDIVIGGARHLDMIPDHRGERLAWRRPLERTLDDIEARRGQKVVVLASGDPMYFGVGEMLAGRFGPNEMRVLPASSAFSLVCARLGWSMNAIRALSLHDRPTSTLRRHLAPGARLVLLSHDGETPHLAATILVEQGYGPSPITVFEHLGGPKERRIDGAADAWPTVTIAALNTIAIECRPGPTAKRLPTIPGIADDAFESDGMLTKREVRAATLARLAPVAGECLWDVGAGSGAVAIEWLRAIERGRALAIERDEERAARIAGNAEWLGTPELRVVRGDAPACLDGLPEPDAVFIGGGITAPDMLPRCWRALRAGGRLVANVVTLEGERLLLDWQARHGGELIRIAISKVETVGPYSAWRPALAVTQLAAIKP